MVSRPRHGAGRPCDYRSCRLAVVAGRPPPARHVLRIARPVQHDVDGARRRRMAAHVVRVCVLPCRGVLGCRQSSSGLCAHALAARDAKPWAQITRHQILRTAAIVLALVLVAGIWSFAVPYALVREELRTEAPPPSRPDHAIDGSSSTAGPGSSSREMSRCGSRAAEHRAPTLRIHSCPEARFR